MISVEVFEEMYDNTNKASPAIVKVVQKITKGVAIVTYQAELDYLTKVLHKLHLQVELLSVSDFPHQQLDFGLRSTLGADPNYSKTFRESIHLANGNVIYKLVDSFLCHYFFLMLPGMPQPTMLFVGPYLLEILNEEQLMERAERLSISPQQFPSIVKCYTSIPALPDETALFSLLLAFGDIIWGQTENYEVVDINEDFLSPFVPLPGITDTYSSDNIMQNMKLMEQRYAVENELIQIVSQGLLHRADQLIASMLSSTFEQRTEDSLRNLKNYCIISNTLLRKAAEQGGVHPIYLDSISADFAQKIEASPTTEATKNLIKDMINSYCRLVKKHTIHHYSSVVQRAITYVDADLSADLSLSALAAALGVNPSYLSALFRRETGDTLTEHVNRKRIERAAQLLQSTKLQVQAISQQCGISDVNYFSKLFKKYTGMTPRAFRAHSTELS